MAFSMSGRQFANSDVALGQNMNKRASKNDEHDKQSNK